MDEIFKVLAPSTFKELLEEMFTGYLNSGEMCSTDRLGELYVLKKLMDQEADKHLGRKTNAKKRKR
ncbi:MAG TPA: hypothetical protein DHV48_12930 [Prolixibacteraceae bacterium]|nr:hypothetical protein [Prolixibacteraceae bacterium]